MYRRVATFKGSLTGSPTTTLLILRRSVTTDVMIDRPVVNQHYGYEDSSAICAQASDFFHQEIVPFKIMVYPLSQYTVHIPTYHSGYIVKLLLL